MKLKEKERFKREANGVRSQPCDEHTPRAQPNQRISGGYCGGNEGEGSQRRG